MRGQKPPKQYLGKLGLRIKLIRTYMRLDQNELAVQLATVQSQVSRIEAGKTVPTLHNLLTIKELADRHPDLEGELSWNWLLHGKGEIFEN